MSDYSELLNSLKAAAGSAANIARDLAGNAGEKARELAGGAGEKARAAAGIAKLKLDLAGKRDEREKAYAEIGRMYFESVDKRAVEDLYVRLFDQVMLAERCHRAHGDRDARARKACSRARLKRQTSAWWSPRLKRMPKARAT